MTPSDVLSSTNQVVLNLPQTIIPVWTGVYTLTIGGDVAVTSAGDDACTHLSGEVLDGGGRALLDVGLASPAHHRVSGALPLGAA